MTNAGLSGLFLHQPSPSAFELVRLYPDGEGCIAAVSGSKNRKKTLDGALQWFGRDRGLPEPARQLFRYDSDSDSGRLDFWTRTFFDLPFHAIGRLDDAGRLVLDWEHRGVRIRSGVVYEPLEDAHAEASPAIAERTLSSRMVAKFWATSRPSRVLWTGSSRTPPRLSWWSWWK